MSAAGKRVSRTVRARTSQELQEFALAGEWRLLQLQARKVRGKLRQIMKRIEEIERQFTEGVQETLEPD
jgi:hypothetical protein